LASRMARDAKLRVRATRGPFQNPYIETNRSAVNRPSTEPFERATIYSFTGQNAVSARTKADARAPAAHAAVAQRKGSHIRCIILQAPKHQGLNSTATRSASTTILASIPVQVMPWSKCREAKNRRCTGRAPAVARRRGSHIRCIILPAPKPQGLPQRHSAAYGAHRNFKRHCEPYPAYAGAGMHAGRALAAGGQNGPYTHTGATPRYMWRTPHIRVHMGFHI
jgi:hypothetical protein